MLGVFACKNLNAFGVLPIPLIFENNGVQVLYLNAVYFTINYGFLKLQKISA